MIVIEKGMLDNYKDKVKSIVGSKVEQLNNNAFEGFENLEVVDFPDLKVIKNETFKDCRNLKILDIPQVKSVGKGAFEGCDALTKLVVKNSETASEIYKNLPGYLKNQVIYKELKIILSENGKTEWAVSNNVISDNKYVPKDSGSNTQENECILEDWIIPDDGCIEEEWINRLPRPFDNSLRIVLPETMSNEISNEIFGKYKDRVGFIYGKNIKEIRAGAFNGCENLFIAAFPRVEAVCDNAFNGCDKLEILVLGDVKAIGDDVFEGCNKLNKIYIRNEEKYDLIYESLPKDIRNNVHFFNSDDTEILRHIENNTDELNLSFLLPDGNSEANSRQMENNQDEISSNVETEQKDSHNEVGLESGQTKPLIDGEIKAVDDDLFKPIAEDIPNVTSITIDKLGSDLTVQDGIFKTFGKLNLIAIKNDPGEENLNKLKDEAKSTGHDVEVKVSGQA